VTAAEAEAVKVCPDKACAATEPGACKYPGWLLCGKQGLTAEKPLTLSKRARREITEALLGGRFDHSWDCSARDTGDEGCDCWRKALRDLLDLAGPCSCGSVALYAEDPPRLGPHHYRSCSRWRASTCTCGAVEVSAVAQHLRPCPLAGS
jgi:hypothetical protein